MCGGMTNVWRDGKVWRVEFGIVNKRGANMEIILDDGNFGSEVLDSTGAVMVDFWAEWCGPCKMLAPVVGEIAEVYEGKVKVCKLDVDKGPETAKKYGIMNIPTIMFFKGGEVVDKIVGLASKNDIISKITQHI